MFKMSGGKINQSLKLYVPSINSMINKMLKIFDRSKPMVTKGEFDLICRNVVNQIFSLISHREIARVYHGLALDFEKKQVGYLEKWFGDDARNIALFTVKILFTYGDLEGDR